jgi:Abnormal spindle-like microcephaly-assoc'd, ASPM-SPD-2-Hydin
MKTIPNLSNCLLFASFAIAMTSHAHGDPFVGEFNPVLEQNDNIKHLAKEGFERFGFTLKITKSDPVHYTAKLTAGNNSITNPLKRIGSRLVNSPRPTDMGDWKNVDFIVLSDGTNGVFAMIGQDSPDDLSCGTALWSESKEEVKPDDFVGTWKADTYGDDNLMNTKDGFEGRKIAFEIRKPDSNHIQVMTPDGSALTLRVSGSAAYLQSPPVKTTSALFHSFRIVTDGQKMAFSLVATELDDPTDVSATIGLGVKKSAGISVQQPAGTQLVDGTAKISFGTQALGGNGRTKTFTIRNSGVESLTGLKIATNGAHAKDFITTTPLAVSLAPGEKTTFKVTFKPTATGTRAAAIHIRSNDANENPFDMTVTGQGAQ